MSMRTDVSLIVHTRNSAARLPPLLASTGWIADRIVVDMASTDDTRVLAERVGCRVVTIMPCDDVDGIRNDHLGLAGSEWTLVLDSDESLAADAEAEISRLITTYGNRHDAFAIPRFNRIAGHVMRGSNWYPDHQIRLFRKGCVAWQAGHHRKIRVTTGDHRLLQLDPPDCLHIHHDNYASLADFVDRQTRYILTDRYDHPFDFKQYLAASHREFVQRHDERADGELSTALAILMAWDQVVRGVIHWERSGRASPLTTSLAMPFVVEVSAPKRSSRRGRIYQALRTFYRHPFALPKRLFRKYFK
jgi:hypothetical protein